MAYVNLPGTYPTLNDGNLRQFIPNADPITLVLGTASTGFTSELYVVNDVNSALVEFGKRSELGKGLVEARDGGATNIALMRLPGTSPSIEAIGADILSSPELGFKVTPVLASVEASTRYGVAYRHAKNISSTGSGVADSKEIVGELCIVDLDKEELVYYGDHTGRIFDDKGVMDIDVRDIYDGSTAAGPESFTLTVSTAPSSAGTAYFTVSGIKVEVALLGTETVFEAATKIHAALDAESGLNCFAIALADDQVKVTASGAVNVNGELVYPSSHTARAGLTARPFIEGFGAGGTGLAYTSVHGTGHTKTADIGAFPLDGLYPFSASGPGEFVELESVVAIGTKLQNYMVGSASSIANNLTFKAGDNGVGISLMERYEKLHETYSLLDFRNFDVVIPQGVMADAKNIEDPDGPGISLDLTFAGELTEAEVDDLSLTESDAGVAYRVTTVDDSLGLSLDSGAVVRWDGSAWADVTGLKYYPNANSSNDVLGKLAIVENSDYTFTYYWDTNDSGAANLSSSGEYSSEASTEDGLVYHEVNFAHQLAVFCYQSSENFQFCHGVIGTSLPTSLSPRGIRTFFGKSPTYTFDPGLEQDVIASKEDNGNGLLGHKIVGGRYGYHFNLKNGGLPLTTDGFFDTSNSSANIVKDRNGQEVDLGKYISVVSMFGHLRNEYENKTGGYLANLSNIYAGLITATPINESTTASRIPAAQMNYYMKGTLADEIAGARLITLVNDEGVPMVVDGATFARPGSDYTRLTSMRIVAKVVEEFRRATKPFYGKGMSTGKRLSHEESLKSVIQKNISEDGTLVSGTFTTSQTRAEKIAGKLKVGLTLKPVFELRSLDLDVSLSI